MTLAPVYGFWAFTYERLNKTLKGYKTNGHAGGEREVSMFRGFKKDVRLRELVVSAAHLDKDLTIKNIAERMLKTDGDTRGTVASLARELDEAAADSKFFQNVYCIFINFSSVDSRFSLGPPTSDNPVLTKTLQQSLVDYYSVHRPEAKVVSRTARLPPGGTRNFLDDQVEYLKYIVLDGRRILPSLDMYRAPNSLIQGRYAGRQYVGQVIKIFKHAQEYVEGYTTLLQVRWFRPLQPGVFDTSTWDK